MTKKIAAKIKTKAIRSYENEAFSKFSNLYKVSKTLRFEARPLSFLKKTGHSTERFDFEFDRTSKGQAKLIVCRDNIGELFKDAISEGKLKSRSYYLLRPYLDKFHSDFIQSSLSGVSYDHEWGELEKSYTNYKKEEDRKKKNKFKKDLEKLQLTLAKKLCLRFSSSSSELFSKDRFKDKKDGTFLSWLANQKYSQREKDKVVEYTEQFNKFLGYLGNYDQIRKNLYRPELKASAVVNRILVDNAPRFFDNSNEIRKLVRNDELKALVEKKLGETYDHFRIVHFTERTYMNFCLTQKGIVNYNDILSIVNLQIKTYNNELEKTDKKFPTLKRLYKQLLSEDDCDDKNENYKRDIELLDDLRSLSHKLGVVRVPKKINLVMGNLNGINSLYIHSKNLSRVSFKFLGNWKILKDATLWNLMLLGQDRSSALKSMKDTYFRVDELNDTFLKYCDFLIENGNPFDGEVLDLSLGIKSFYKATGELFSNLKSREKELLKLKGHVEISKEEDQVLTIKLYLDSALELEASLKLFSATSLEEFDLELSTNLIVEDFLNQEISNVPSLYNRARKYLSKKHYSVEKFKLNFENPQFAAGWAKNKESDYGTSLFRRDGQYFLCLMTKGNRSVFNCHVDAGDSENIIAKKNERRARMKSRVGEKNFEKMSYLLIPDPSKMLPKVFFSKNNIEFFAPSKEILKIKSNESFKKESNDKASCSKLVNFYIKSINKHVQWSKMGFVFKKASEYESYAEFIEDVRRQGYVIGFDCVSSDYLQELSRDGKISLFHLYNKDFSPYSKGRKNLHTIYWESLFSKGNIDNTSLKLDGGAEMFFREASIFKKDVIVHKKGSVVKSKTQGYNQKKILQYDIVKDRRFTCDKFTFHCPISLNFPNSRHSKINDLVNKYALEKTDLKYVGIERGDRHLLYLVLCDSEGRVIKQRSLNLIEDETFSPQVNYLTKINHREVEQKDAGKSWKSDSKIKDLKKGYLSQVVHVVSKLIVEENAIVVLEDLRVGTGNDSKRIDQRLYQGFIRDLISKLNFLVFKDKLHGELGSTGRAYQLTNPFDSFLKLGKQNGVLFFTPNEHTIAVDPNSGFVCKLPLKYQNRELAKSLICSFKRISFNTQQQYFEFSFQYEDVVKLRGLRGEWVLCTHGEYRNILVKGINKRVMLNQELIEIFSSHNINLEQENLIADITLKNSSKLYSKIYFILDSLCRFRYQTEDNEEVLISPVVGRNGQFFDSRKTEQTFLPSGSDANGAYHMALKGKLMIEKMREENSLSPSQLTNEDWFTFLGDFHSVSKPIEKLATV